VAIAGKSKPLVTISAVITRADGTKVNAGVISGKRNPWQWLRYKMARRKLRKYNQRRAAEMALKTQCNAGGK
jgi:hypothetical protein